MAAEAPAEATDDFTVVGSTSADRRCFRSIKGPLPSLLEVNASATHAHAHIKHNANSWALIIAVIAAIAAIC
jgi:hypothetical protein